MIRYFFIMLFCMPATVGAVDLGVVGKVYPIKERDALEEVESRMNRVDWKKELAKIKPENYRPQDGVSLPRATKGRSFLVDMSYTLERDVPDGRGGVVYPKGFTFNPLDYVSYPVTLVVVNGDDKAQMAWLRKSSFATSITSKILLTGGSALKVSEYLRRPVFYADSTISTKFRLSAVPSVIMQTGRMMKVEEIDVQLFSKN